MTDQPQPPENPDAGNGAPEPGYGTPDPGYGTPQYGGAPQDGGIPGAPGVPAAAQKTNPLAIASLVASLVGLLCGIGAIIGIVLGVVALNQINQRGESGKNLALAGIIIGGAAIALSVLFFVLV